MLLSIIIPTYNRAHLIESTLKSVLDQTCDDFEVLIIDDGSTDNTVEIVTPFLSEKIHYYPIKNGERGAARNFGTQHAKGMYVNWLDSDDLLLPNHVSAIREAVSKNEYPEILVFGYKNYFPKNNSYTPGFTLPEKDDQIKRQLVQGNCFSCNAVIVKTTIALENEFNENRKLSASEDYELWLRLAAKYPILSINEVTSVIIHHPERSVLTMNQMEQLENRFTTFIETTTSNNEVVAFLSGKSGYFKMRNYLILAVDLASNKHKSKARKYLFIAFRNSKKAVFQRVFWATLKHLVF